ncbi:hypothetical protein [Flavobacterium sp.]|uniref:hypothetical protein n=1 Tax=Flavobacterium sp. TaxID=239 RepID=UPI003752FB4F
MEDGQPHYANYSFNSWLEQNNDLNSFKFNGNNPMKSIPKAWLIDAKNAMNNGENINRNWFNNFYNAENNDDCRASVAMWLLNNH